MIYVYVIFDDNDDESILLQVFEDEAITDDEDENSSESEEHSRHTNKISRHTKQNTIKYESDDENVSQTRVTSSEHVETGETSTALISNVDDKSSNINKGL